jgi:hypothetical protein
MIYLMNAAIYHEIAQYKEQRNKNYQKQIEKINKKEIMEMSVLGELLEIPLKE